MIPLFRAASVLPANGGVALHRKRALRPSPQASPSPSPRRRGRGRRRSLPPRPRSRLETHPRVGEPAPVRAARARPGRAPQASRGTRLCASTTKTGIGCSSSHASSNVPAPRPAIGASAVSCHATCQYHARSPSYFAASSASEPAGSVRASARASAATTAITTASRRRPIPSARPTAVPTTAASQPPRLPVSASVVSSRATRPSAGSRRRRSRTTTAAAEMPIAASAASAFAYPSGSASNVPSNASGGFGGPSSNRCPNAKAQTSAMPPIVPASSRPLTVTAATIAAK